MKFPIVTVFPLRKSAKQCDHTLRKEDAVWPTCKVINYAKTILQNAAHSFLALRNEGIYVLM